MASNEEIVRPTTLEDFVDLLEEFQDDVAQLRESNKLLKLRVEALESENV